MILREENSNANGEPAKDDIESIVVGKVTRHCFHSYHLTMVNFIDRVNIGFAR